MIILKGIHAIFFLDESIPTCDDLVEKTYKLELIDNGKEETYIKSIKHFQEKLTLYAECKAIPK